MQLGHLIHLPLLAGVLAITLAHCTESSPSQGFDWPRWHGPSGNRVSLGTQWNPSALAEGPRVLWKPAVGMGYSNVAIKGNRLYKMGVRMANYAEKKIWLPSVGMN